MIQSFTWERVDGRYYRLQTPSFELTLEYFPRKREYVVGLSTPMDGDCGTLTYYSSTNQVLAERPDNPLAHHKKTINASCGLPDEHLKTLQRIMDEIELNEIEFS